MAKRKLASLPEATRTQIKLMVAHLILLWGATPGLEPDRAKAYNRLRKKLEAIINKWNLDLNDVYFVFGDPGDPRERSWVKSRAQQYINAHEYTKEWDPRG